MDPKVEIEVNHYRVLGLPYGLEGAKITVTDIKKAYKLKAKEVHPDKCPNDPHAHSNFLKLRSSYEILIDEKSRKVFDDFLRDKHQQQQQQQRPQTTKTQTDQYADKCQQHRSQTTQTRYEWTMPEFNKQKRKNSGFVWESEDIRRCFKEGKYQSFRFRYGGATLYDI